MTEEQIRNSIRAGRNPHAILLTGPQGLGKLDMARRLAALYCTGEADAALLKHEPNYTEINEEKYLIDTVRAALENTNLVGFNGGRRAYVLCDVHRMTEQTQNVLLKTIEEPPRDAIFLLTGIETGILQTIRSRCAVIRLSPIDTNAIMTALMDAGEAEETARLAALLSGGVPGRASRYCEAKYLEQRENYLSLLEQTLFGLPPLLELNALLAKSKGKDDKTTETITELLIVWELVLSDALHSLAGMGGIRNIDVQALVERIAKRFTIQGLQGMIDKIVEAETELFYRVNAAYLMDSVVVTLSGYNKEKHR